MRWSPQIFWLVSQRLRSQASFAELFFTMILAYVVLTVATKEVPAEWKTKQRLGYHVERPKWPVTLQSAHIPIVQKHVAVSLGHPVIHYCH